MQEHRDKYKGVRTVRAAPMMDAPVVVMFGRTMVEILGPIPFAAFGIWAWGLELGLLAPIVVFVALPYLRWAFERNRALHWFWGMGLAAGVRMVERIIAGRRWQRSVPSPFTSHRVARFRP